MHPVTFRRFGKAEMSLRKPAFIAGLALSAILAGGFGATAANAAPGDPEGSTTSSTTASAGASAEASATTTSESQASDPEPGDERAEFSRSRGDNRYDDDRWRDHDGDRWRKHCDDRWRKHCDHDDDRCDRHHGKSWCLPGCKKHHRHNWEWQGAKRCDDRCVKSRHDYDDDHYNYGSRDCHKFKHCGSPNIYGAWNAGFESATVTYTKTYTRAWSSKTRYCDFPKGCKHGKNCNPCIKHHQNCNKCVKFHKDCKHISCKKVCKKNCGHRVYM